MLGFIGDLTTVNGLMFAIIVEKASCSQMYYKFICENVRKTIRLCLEVYLVVKVQLELDKFLRLPVKDQLVYQTSLLIQLLHPICLVNQILEPSLKVAVFLSLRIIPFRVWVVSTKDI